MKNLTVKRFLMAMVLTVLVGCSIHMMSANALDNTALAETENLDEVPTNTSVYPLDEIELNEETTTALSAEKVNEDTNEEKPEETEEVNEPEEIKEEVKEDIKEVSAEEIKEEETTSAVEDTENSINNTDEEISMTNEEVNTETTEKVEKPQDNYACAGDAYQTQLLNDINAYRVANGLGTLTLDSRLNSSAFVRAQEIYSSHGHQRPDGSAWYTSLTFSPNSAVAENVGCQVSNYIFDLWKASASHNQAMLTGKYTRCGIGYYNAPDGGLYVALHLY